MQPMIFAIKIDVDTERGTRIGVPNLLSLLQEVRVPATFLFSLGPDNTGRAIKRVLRRGFLKKVSRTSVVSTYGIRTLLNGVLLPGPHIARLHAALLRQARDAGFEVGIHSYDHQRWQDGVAKMSKEEVAAEFTKAGDEFRRVFDCAARTAGAPGWQANAKTLAAYDAAEMVHASDCRGAYPFLPEVDGQRFRALQIPTTLPTLDEMIGRAEFGSAKCLQGKNISEHYFSLLSVQHPNVMTIHAELEGMKYLVWFREFLLELRQRYLDDIQFKTLNDVTQKILAAREQFPIPVCRLEQAEIEGRSGLIAVQGDAV